MYPFQFVITYLLAFALGLILPTLGGGISVITQPQDSALSSALSGSSTSGALSSQLGEAAVSQHELLVETNRTRMHAGLMPVKPSEPINDVAQDWAESMASREQLVHSPNYHDQYPAGWRRASENILYSSHPTTAEHMVQLWYDSPGHRENMMDPHITHVGFGIAATPEGEQYAVQNFAQY